MSLVCPKSLRWHIISCWSIGCQCAIQWLCISEPDSKCKSIVVFAVTWNRYFCWRCESHLESDIVHILVISGFSRKNCYSYFSVLLLDFTCFNYPSGNCLYLFIYLFAHLFIYLFIYLSIYLLIHLLSNLILISHNFS